MTTALPSTARSLPLRQRRVLSRVAASLAGAWIFTFGFTSVGIALLLRAGMGYADARTLAYLLAFLVFLAAICWTFAARSVAWLWLTFVAGGAAMTGVAWLLVRTQG